MTDTPEPDCPAPTRGYVLCTVARSGSSWFARILRSTGQLGVPAEYFNPEYIRENVSPRRFSAREKVDLLLAQGVTANGIYALKAFPIHMNPVMAHLDLLDALPDLRFVLWKRRDLLGQALSLSRATQTQQWRSTYQSRREPFYDGNGVYELLLRIARQYARWEVFFARNAIEPLRLFYEDAMEDPQRAADSIASLLSLEPCRPVDLENDHKVQRDDVTVAWRERFLSEFGGFRAVDDL